MVVDGMTVNEVCQDLPDLTSEDVAEALRYAAETVRERQLPLRPSARHRPTTPVSSDRSVRCALAADTP
jgi:hypothetical protein